uniref:Uncharacterized protein n=1 Tax=Rhizophora mucronata TaxID=61149 RepID=A0A2P2J3R9_RHIMU
MLGFISIRVPAFPFFEAVLAVKIALFLK